MDILLIDLPGAIAELRDWHHDGIGHWGRFALWVLLMQGSIIRIWVRRGDK